MREPEPVVIRAAAAGDHDAFEQLVRDHRRHVWRFLRRLVGDDALAEDVTQETFLRVYRRLGTFTFQSRFTTWLFQIARNAGIDELRRRERRSRLAAESAAARGPAVVAPPDFTVELQLALNSLTPTLRTALLLVEILGLRYREAAEVLDIPEGTVKSRVFKARLQLHRWADAGSSPEVGGPPGDPGTGTASDEV